VCVDSAAETSTHAWVKLCSPSNWATVEALQALRSTASLHALNCVVGGRRARTHLAYVLDCNALLPAVCMCVCMIHRH
jgi:hypothetical protein